MLVIIASDLLNHNNGFENNEIGHVSKDVTYTCAMLSVASGKKRENTPSIVQHKTFVTAILGQAAALS